MAGIPVRYNQVIAIIMLVAGVFILGTGLLLGTVLQIGLGALNTLLGLGFLTQPWFVVFSDRIELRNVLGMTLKTHSIGSLEEIEVRDGKVHSRSGRFNPIGGWLARSSDLEAVAEAIRKAGY